MLFEPEERERIVAAADKASLILENGLRVLLWIVALAVFAGAILIIAKMDGGSRSQGGRIYVAIGAMIALGAIDNQFDRLARRGWVLFPPRSYWRYKARSLLLLVAAAVVLIGLALYLP